MARQLTILSLDYYPNESNEGFQDDVEDITSLQFNEFGVKCKCTGKTYYNKYTFRTLHIKTQKHQDYLAKLIDNKPNLVKTLKENQLTIKTLKIQLGSTDQKLTQITHLHKISGEKLSSLSAELSELKTQLSDRDEYIASMELKCAEETDASVKEMSVLNTSYHQLKEASQEKHHKTEAILKQLMTLYDYEVD